MRFAVKEPRRLSDDPEVHASIRDALVTERSMGGRALLDVAEGWKKLEAAALTSASAAALVEEPSGGQKDASTDVRGVETGRTSLRWLHLGIGITALLGVGVVTQIAASPKASKAVDVVAKPANSTLVETGALPTASESPAPSSSTVDVSTLPAASPAPVTAKSTLRAAGRGNVTLRTERPADADDDVREELAQMVRIRRLVEQEPAAGLALAEEGQRKFARGYLVEEREGLAIVALARLGRREEAQARAARFFDRYPKSALVDRIRIELGKNG